MAREPAVATVRAPRNWRPAIIGGGALVLLLLAIGVGYAHWTGLIGDRPGSIAREVTSKLKEEGFSNVMVTMGKDWIALVSGSVVGQENRQALEATLRGRSEIRGTNFDALEVRPGQDELGAEITKALAANRLGHITAEVDENGAVILTGRAEKEYEVGSASDVVMSVPGVSAVDPRIGLPFAVLQGQINQALRDSGFTGVRADVRGTDDISVIGTLREEQYRAAVIAKVVETAAGLSETIDAAAVRDEMTVDAPAVKSPATKDVAPAQVATPPTANLPSTSPEASGAESSSQASLGVNGTWAGPIDGKWVQAADVRIWVEQTTKGVAAGRTEYTRPAPYNRTTIVCQGVLYLVEASSDQFVFREGITQRSEQSCPGEGLIKLRLVDPTTVEAQWTPLKRPDKVGYSGTLRRR